MWTFNVFTPFLLTRGGPGNQTEVLAIYTYRVAFRDFQFGLGAAVGVVVMVINLAFALFYLWVSKRAAPKKVAT
jgi:multiple sugar transport system permease protein